MRVPRPAGAQGIAISIPAQGLKVPHGVHGFGFILGHSAPFSHQGRDLEKQCHEQGGEEGLHLKLLTWYQQQLVDGPGGLE